MPMIRHETNGFESIRLSESANRFAFPLQRDLTAIIQLASVSMRNEFIYL